MNSGEGAAGVPDDIAWRTVAFLASWSWAVIITGEVYQVDRRQYI